VKVAVRKVNPARTTTSSGSPSDVSQAIEFFYYHRMNAPTNLNNAPGQSLAELNSSLAQSTISPGKVRSTRTGV